MIDKGFKAALGASVFWAFAGYAQAQATAGVPAATAGARQPSGGADASVGEIVVTAERRSSTALQTPISMTAISGQDMAAQGVNKISDLERVSPSLSINNAGSFNYINIRGIGNAVSIGGTTSGVAVIQDGLFEPDTTGLNNGFFDIDNVEVLRGPQGTFIGASSTGGAMLIRSRDPDLSGDVSGFLEGEFGSYNRVIVDGAITLPIRDTLAARFAFSENRRDSYYTNLGSSKTPGNVNDQAFRVSLLWQPSDAFKALLKAEFTYTDNDGNAGVPIENPYVDPSTGQLVHSAFWQFSTHIPYLINFDYNDTYLKERHQRYLADLSYEFADGITLRSIAGYQHSNLVESVDEDGTASSLATPSVPGQTVLTALTPKRYWSEDLMLVSPESWRFHWIVGGSYFYRYVDNLTRVNLGGVEPYIVEPLTTKRWAVFGQAGYNLTDKLELQVGLRDNIDHNTGVSTTTVTIPAANLVIPQPTVSAVYDSNNVTGRVGINWRPDHDAMVYAFYARGYKSGGVNPGADNFLAEHVDDFELGIKGRALGGILRYEIGGYYMNFKNMQVQTVDLATGNNNAIANLAGTSTVKGVDATLSAHVHGFELGLNASYIASRLGTGDLVALYALPGAATGAPQCPGPGGVPCFSYGPYTVNVAGSHNPYAPEWTVGASIAYNFHFGRNNTLTPRLTFNHTDRQYASVFQSDDFYLMGERNLLQLSLTYAHGPWTVEGYVHNLTDQTYLAGIFQGPAGLTGYYGAPREFGVRIGRSF